MKRKKILKIIFVSLILLCTIFVIVTPLLPISDFGYWQENFLKTGIILGLMIFVYLTHFFYFQQTKKSKKYQGNLEERLLDSFKYIGTVNLQLEELRKNLFSFKKYPSNRKEFSKLMLNLSEKILSIVNIDWVIVKIIDIKTKKTLHYVSLIRGGKELKLDKFDNNELLSEKNNQNFAVIKSSQENLKIKAICVLPGKIKNQDESFFLSHIINQLELLFLAFLFLKKK